MKNTIDIIQTVIALFFAFGGGTWLSNKLKLDAAARKNENVKFMETIAAHAVLAGQAFAGSGKVQQQEALLRAQERLAENGLSKYFSASQIAQYIEQKYTELKANGQLAQVSPLVSDEDFEAAKKEIEGEK